MPALNANLAKFAAYDAQVVGISTDSIYCHIAWQEKGIGNIDFPLASDYFPHGEVAKKYGVQRLGDPIPGINDRSIFIIDKQGKVVFRQVYELGELPENDEIFEALQKISGAAA
jgi:alkyl hydroperoxide reductase subunit AhpC